MNLDTEKGFGKGGKDKQEADWMSYHFSFIVELRLIK
jgi:hypothetical protein